MIMFSKYKYLLLAMANCGIITGDIAKRYYKKHRESINYLLKNNYIKDIGICIIWKKATRVYILSNKSKSILKAYGKNIYKTDLKQLEHDYLLQSLYSNLENNIQETWKNESELKVIYKGKCTTDAIFIKDEKVVAVEVITPSYSKEKVQLKKEFVNCYAHQYIELSTVKAMASIEKGW